MWALDDFTAENRATIIYPGSNRCPETTPTHDAVSIQAVMPAGSVLIWPGRTFHGGGANRTEHWRLGLVAEGVASFIEGRPPRF